MFILEASALFNGSRLAGNGMLIGLSRPVGFNKPAFTEVWLKPVPPSHLALLKKVSGKPLRFTACRTPLLFNRLMLNLAY